MQEDDLALKPHNSVSPYVSLASPEFLENILGKTAMQAQAGRAYSCVQVG